MLLAGLLRALRWRVWGSMFLLGLPLTTWTGHALVLAMAESRPQALLLDAAGAGWGVVAAGLALAAVAFGQLVGVESGKISLARSIVPTMVAGIAALVLGVQGWVEGVGLVAGMWFGWFAFVAAAVFLGGIRYDTSARHHAGRVLMGFLVVIGAVLLTMTVDHIVLALGEHAMTGVSDARRAVMEIDARYLRKGVRKISFFGVVFAGMLAGSASQGSIGISSDLKGSMTGLLGLAGLAVFVAFEGWLATTSW